MSESNLHITKILIIDDNQALVDSLRELLKRKGYEVHIAYDCHSGYEKIKERNPHLVVLDLDFGSNHYNGYTLLDNLRMRDKNFVPVIVMTDLEKQVLAAFEGGADDFVKKHSDMDEELIVRIRRMFPFPRPPRTEAIPSPALHGHNYWVSDQLIFNVTIHRVYYGSVENELTLTHKALDVLKYLMFNYTINLSREKLRDELWPHWAEKDVSLGAVTQRISEIRKAIADQDDGDGYTYIKTVRGGYRYIQKWSEEKCL